MASELRVNTLKDASGNNSVATSVVFGGTAKAWCHFKGTETEALLDSYNFSSVDDDGTGNYGMHFTSNMTNALYAFTAGNTDDGAGSSMYACDITENTMATGNFDIEVFYVNSSTNRTDVDLTEVYMVVHGDLA